MPEPNAGTGDDHAARPPLSGWARWAVLGLGVAWFGVVFRLALMETQRTIPGLDENSDELAHLLAWAGLAAVLFLALDRPGRTAVLWVLVLVVSAAAGIAVELAQLGTENRSFELSDVVFDVVGAWLGLCTALVLSRGMSRQGLLALLGGVVAVVGVAVLFTEPAEEDLGPTAGTRTCAPRPFEPRAFPPGGSGHAEPLLLYPMDEGVGDIVHEAGGGPDIDIADPDDTPWAAGGGLDFTSGSSPVASRPAGELFSSRARASGEFSIEVWFSAAELPQYGPARVVTVSNGTDSSMMNAHLGIEDHGISVRVRTDCDESNEIVFQDVLTPGRIHQVVLTYHPGEISLGLDGEMVGRTRVYIGMLDVWDDGLPLVLGDEATGNRPMAGTIRRVALYDTVLDPAQITDLFDAGPTAGS